MSTNSMPPIATANVNDQLFTNALSAAYRNRTWLYNPDIALKRDASSWEKIQRYPKIAHALQKRCHMVTTRDWMIEPGGEEPGDKQLASIVEQEFRSVKGLPQCRFRLSRAPILGTANEWMEGQRQIKQYRLANVEAPVGPPKDAEKKPPANFLAEPPDPQAPAPAKKTPFADWFSFTSFRHIDYRRIRRVPVWTPKNDGTGDELLDVELHLGSIANIGTYAKIEHVECLLRIEYDDEEGRLGYGRGLMEAIYWGFWILETLWREGLTGVEKWANGLLVASVDEAARGMTTKDAQTVAAAFLSTLDMMRGRGIFVKSKSDEIEVIERTGTGHEALVKLIGMVEDALMQLILGSVRPSGGGEGGTYGQGKVEERSTEDVIQFDRQLLDDAITEKMIGLWIELNGPQLAECGLAAAARPRFVSIEGDDEDPVKFGEIVKAAQAAGLEVTKAEAYRRFGLKRPGPDDEILEAPKPELPPGFGGGAPGKSPFDDLAGAGKGEGESPFEQAA